MMSNAMDRPRGNPHYRAIIISPHLDDAVFSCGGLIAQLVKDGPVLVLNIFTRYLSDVKAHGVVLSEKRYQEEEDASRLLGFESRSIGELDVSFRREAYRQLGNIFRPPVAEDMDWLPILRKRIFTELARSSFQQLYVPLGIGWHVDHVLTYLVFESWLEKDRLVYYEDTPYCCIPHSTRYRLNEIAKYPRQRSDESLAPVSQTRAWWQASMAYANTALMRNLEPWIVRRCAVPVVSFYLYCQITRHKTLISNSDVNYLRPMVLSIDQEFSQKIFAMAAYASQFREFFSSSDDCASTLLAYSTRLSHDAIATERYWMLSSADSAALQE